MQLFLTPLPVFLATCAGFLFGGLWYSPILFLKSWQKVQGVTKDTMPKRSKRYIFQTNSYSFVAHGCIVAVLAVVFDLIEVPTLKAAVAVGAILAIGFVVTSRYIDMVYTMDGTHWERRSQVRFLISAGYYLGTIIVMSAVLFLVGFPTV
jgi:uncharacterized membrane protein (DUF485 family)